ncbi:MAG TPA: OFA family MFS transporter [Candidatus Baltobacteraceae bacterium]|nr:OFA family MFS transporter [Candidatus Baltobacteraceae bacterium]
MASSAAGSGNRWGIALAGIIVMLCLGTVYSWSIFTNSLIAGFNWSTQDATIPFETAIFFLGLGAVFGGRWQDRVGPRTVTIVGVVLWGVGVLLAGLGTQSLGKLWLDVTYGVIGGFGNGMAYVTPVAMVTKWFPDRRGLGSGMVVMGFGLGAFVYNQVITRLAVYGAAAKPALKFVTARADAIKAGTTFDPTTLQLSSDAVHGVMTLFIVSGIVFIVLGGLAAMMLRNPEAGYSIGGATAAAIAHSPSYTPGEALGMGQLYGLWLLLFLNVTAGIFIISNAVPMISQFSGAGAAVAAQWYGFIAVFNGLGRFFWGSISDRLGRGLTYTVMYLVQVVIFFIVGHLAGLGGILTCFAIVLLCYGGGFGVMPSFNADFFGTKYMGQIYGFILTAWGLAGVVGPFIAGFVQDKTGSYSGALVWIAGMLIVAAIIPFFVKKPTGQPAAA